MIISLMQTEINNYVKWMIFLTVSVEKKFFFQILSTIYLN